MFVLKADSFFVSLCKDSVLVFLIDRIVWAKVASVAIFLSFGDSTSRLVDWSPGLPQFLFPLNKFLWTCAPAKIMLHAHTHRVMLILAGTSQKVLRCLIYSWESYQVNLSFATWFFTMLPHTILHGHISLVIKFILLIFCAHAFDEFSDKNICHYSKRARTCHLLWERPGYYHSISKTHMRDRIFKLSPIYSSVIYQITWIHWIEWQFCSI